ncbi:uncharacterized protein LOC130763263 isoform X3 [Actinidia eriantha]|uniref:uncharacterized protein LOC130763263 isoform X3 n=1 Tax=Actinidia eriantha TaxID=165200 RepID=UPI00258CFE1A|nr:uncharacterized protein LOC130763263 isoform X3 [Actinidia eriantha]
MDGCKCCHSYYGTRVRAKVLLTILFKGFGNFCFVRVKRVSKIKPRTKTNMKSAFRNAYFTLSRSLNPNGPNPSPQFSLIILFPLRTAITDSLTTIDKLRPLSAARRCYSSSMEEGEALAPPSPSSTLEKQFDDFRQRLDESGSLRERIRGVAMEIESVTRLMHSSLLLVHQSRPVPVNNSEFGLDIEEYLIGICFMSNELPRYVVNQVTAGDYDCPRKVLKFLTELHAAFRMLNLRNDFLRKKFDGMKYDLRRVEEVYYDVKIRGLAVNGDSMGDQGIQGES